MNIETNQGNLNKAAELDRKPALNKQEIKKRLPDDETAQSDKKTLPKDQVVAYTSQCQSKRDHFEDRYCIFQGPQFVSELIPQELIEYILSEVVAELSKQVDELNLNRVGSTLVISMQLHGKVYTANLGDSRTIAFTRDADKNYQPCSLNWLHKPTDDDEQSRIRKVKGAEVYKGALVNKSYRNYGMVDIHGVNVSGGLGDNDITGVRKQPSLTTKIITKQGYLVLTSDGVDKALTSIEIADILSKLGSDDNPADEIRKQAYLRGSNDNISVVVLPLLSTSEPLVAVMADGHGGEQIAEYVKQNFEKIFNATVNTISQVQRYQCLFNKDSSDKQIYQTVLQIKQDALSSGMSYIKNKDQHVNQIFGQAYDDSASLEDNLNNLNQRIAKFIHGYEPEDRYFFEPSNPLSCNSKLRIAKIDSNEFNLAKASLLDQENKPKENYKRKKDDPTAESIEGSLDLDDKHTVNYQASHCFGYGNNWEHKKSTNLNNNNNKEPYFEDRYLVFKGNHQWSEKVDHDLVITILQKTIAKLIEKTKDFDDNCGSTLVISVQLNGYIYTANLGDSRAIAFTQADDEQNYSPCSLNWLHQADDPDERRRINDIKGASVNSWGRLVNSSGSYTHSLEPSGGVGNHSMIGLRRQPSITVKSFKNKQGYLVLTSDGVDEALCSSDLADIITEHHDKNNIADEIRKQAYLGGSNDNIAVLALELANTQVPVVAVMADAHGGSAFADYIHNHIEDEFNAAVSECLATESSNKSEKSRHSNNNNNPEDAANRFNVYTKKLELMARLKKLATRKDCKFDDNEIKQLISGINKQLKTADNKTADQIISDYFKLIKKYQDLVNDIRTQFYNNSKKFTGELCEAKHQAMINCAQSLFAWDPINPKQDINNLDYQYLVDLFKTFNYIAERLYTQANQYRDNDPAIKKSCEDIKNTVIKAYNNFYKNSEDPETEIENLKQAINDILVQAKQTPLENKLFRWMNENKVSQAHSCQNRFVITFEKILENTEKPVPNP